MPLATGRKQPHAHLLVAYILALDNEGLHLTVTKSGYSLYLDEECNDMVLHYDYDRSPENDDRMFASPIVPFCRSGF